MNKEQSKRILVVDDEPDVLNMLKMRLESAGYEVTTAGNGQEGLDKVNEGTPDLIISDVLMPVMDGFAFYKELKNSELTREIPVLILTARGKMEDSFKVVGADDFIAKPFKSEELLSKVQDLVVTKTAVKRVEQGKRVLVAGDDSSVVEEMSVNLKQVGCLTDLVTTGPQVISKVVTFLPQILVIEVEMADLPTSEVINVLRRMPQSEKISILTYSYYRVDALGSEDIRQRALSVGANQQKCSEAGATEFIGRYNENTFVNQVAKYLKK